MHPLGIAAGGGYAGNTVKVIRHVADPLTKTTVRELMAKSIVSGDPRQSLTEAAAQMRASRISALAVLDVKGIVGIITERDLLRAIADGRIPEATHISQYMTHSPRTIEAAEPAARAAEVMVKHHVRHLPVTDKGRLVGFLSARDLLALKPWPRNLPIGESW
jgi:CBS domain-containing protein